MAPLPAVDDADARNAAGAAPDTAAHRAQRPLQAAGRVRRGTGRRRVQHEPPCAAYRVDAIDGDRLPRPTCPEAQTDAGTDLIEQPIHPIRAREGDGSASAARVAQQAPVDLEQSVRLTRRREESRVHGCERRASAGRCRARWRGAGTSPVASADASTTRRGSRRRSRNDRGGGSMAMSPGARAGRGQATAHPRGRGRRRRPRARGCRGRRGLEADAARRRRRPARRAGPTSRARGKDQAAQEHNGQAHEGIIVAESDIDLLIDELNARHAPGVPKSRPEGSSRRGPVATAGGAGHRGRRRGGRPRVPARSRRDRQHHDRHGPPRRVAARGGSPAGVRSAAGRQRSPVGARREAHRADWRRRARRPGDRARRPPCPCAARA